MVENPIYLTEHAKVFKSYIAVKEKTHFHFLR